MRAGEGARAAAIFVGQSSTNDRQPSVAQSTVEVEACSLQTKIGSDMCSRTPLRSGDSYIV